MWLVEERDCVTILEECVDSSQSTLKPITAEKQIIIRRQMGDQIKHNQLVSVEKKGIGVSDLFVTIESYLYLRFKSTLNSKASFKMNKRDL